MDNSIKMLFSNSRFNLVAITAIFVIINSLLYFNLGVSVDYDTERYLTYAKEIREHGIFFKPHDFWYITYPLFIILVTSIHDSFMAIVLAQICLSYFAMISLYFSAIRIFNNKFAAFLSSLWFLGFVMISFWNFWIYCESLLISLTCISFFFLIKWKSGQSNFFNLLLGIPIIIVAMLTKPTGIALLTAILVSFSYNLYFRNQDKLNLNSRNIYQTAKDSQSLGYSGKENKGFFKNSISAFVIFIILFFGFLILLNKMLTTFTYERDYQLGEIIYNIHKLADQPYAKWLIINTPKNLYIPNQSWPPLVKFIALIFGNPWYSIKLFLVKLFFYTLYIRPYYSLSHNLLALAVLIPMYISAICIFRSRILKTDIKILILVYIGISTISVTFLTVDWNSRFLVPILPVLFLIGSEGISKWILNFLKSYLKKQI